VGRDQDHAEQGVAKVDRRWQAAIGKGALPVETYREMRGRLCARPFGAEAFEGVSTVLEALPEGLRPKVLALTALARWSAPRTLLLSGTSAIPISALAEPSLVSGRLLGFHLFMPVPRMALVEVAVPLGAPQHLVDRARELAGLLHKRVVLVRDQPGFAAARMALAQGLEAMRLLESGVATAEDLDALLTLGYGHPMGPLELSDRIGLDLRLRIAEGILASGESSYAPPAILKELVARGDIGRKSGQGFYAWDHNGKRL
jgi:3-hydroxybutyryl-CoA dehydrogenase